MYSKIQRMYSVAVKGKPVVIEVIRPAVIMASG